MADLVKATAIVVVHHGKPFSNTLAIADGVGLEHQFVIRLVRKYEKDFQEFGKVAFETRNSPEATSDFQSRNSRGRPTEYAELNEDQATYLMTLFRNTEVVRAFKIKLVKAFRKAINELTRLRNQRQDPEWQQARITQKAAQRITNQIVQTVREECGKSTGAHHFINEELLLNELVTGIRQATNRDTWPPEAINFSVVASTKNASLAIRGLSNKERRKALLPWAAQARPFQGQLLEDAR